MKSLTNLTFDLLKMIGSPSAPSTEIPLSPQKSLQLHNYSIKNRISLIYLETLRKNEKLKELKTIYEMELKGYLKTLDAIARVSRVLINASVEHAIYKTIRPYHAKTVDIDILIFDSEIKHRKTVRTLLEAKYQEKKCGPRSTTLYDPETNIGIDLYEEVAVSLITYLDKEKLITHITTTKLPNGDYVKTLTPEADLATIIAHSIIKEHMFPLSEYYTFLYYLPQIDVQNFIKIVRENNITCATKTHAAITATLHKAAHGMIPNELQQIRNQLCNETFETAFLIKRHFKMPHKYHPFTVAQSLLEIAKGEKSRRSIATQLLYMLNPTFTKDVIKGLVDHVTRETY